MMDKLQIHVDNFSFIDEADFELDSITVVKGIGGKGKSDLNRILYSLLLTVSNEGLNIANSGFKGVLSKPLNIIDYHKIKNEFDEFIEDGDDYNISHDYLTGKFEEYKKLLNKHNITVDYSEIEQAITFNDELNSYRLPVFYHLLEMEFKTKKYERFDDYNVTVKIDDEYSLINDKKDGLIQSKFSYEMENLPGNIIYFSPKPIIDFNNEYDIPYHYQELYYLLTHNKIHCNEDNMDIINYIGDIIGGDIILAGDFMFLSKDDDEIPIEDLPRGYKHLGVLQSLLMAHAIPRKSILIIDNIDSRMDEDLQSKTAEILVKLANRLDLFLFINTKNDFFFNEIKNQSSDTSIRRYEAIENKNGKFNFKVHG